MHNTPAVTPERSGSAAPSHLMRRTSRTRCEIPVTLVSLDPRLSMRLTGLAMVVNVHGGCVQAPHPLPPGTRVRVEVGERRALGRVVNTTPIDEHSCVLALALDEPGNIWGIKDPPADWGPAIAVAPELAAPAPAPSPSPTLDPATFELLREEITAQLTRLQKMHAEQLVILQEERASARAAREAAERGIAEQIERVRQVRQYVESLACSIPNAIKTQAQEQAKTLLQHLDRESPADAVPAAGAVDALDQKLAARVSQLGQQLRRELREDLEKHVPAAASTAGIGQESGPPTDAIRQQLDTFVQQRLQQFDAQKQTTLAHLQKLEGRAETLVSLVDLELQNHADQMVQDSIAHIREELARESATVCEQRLAQVHTDVAGGLEPILQRAEAVRAGLQELLQKREEQTGAAPGQSAEMTAEARQKLIDQLRQNIDVLFAERQQKFELACESAMLQLQQVEQRAQAVPPQLNAEVQKHAQESVRAAVAQVSGELQRESAAVRAQHAEQMRAATEEMRRRVLDDARQQVETLFAARQQEFRAAYETAAAQLQELQNRAETVKSLVNVELQKHTEESVRAAVAQVSGELQRESAAVRAQHAEQMRGAEEELRGRVLDQARQQVETLFAARQQEFRAAQEAAIEQLKQLESRADTLVSVVDVELQNHCAESLRDASAQARQEVEREAAAELARLRETVHQLCAEAGGEIRGRMGQAVETASDTLEQRAAALNAGLAESARKQTSSIEERVGQVRHELESSLQDVHGRFESAQAAADAALQAHFTGIVEACRVDLEALAHSSVERWRATIHKSMAAMEGVLADAAHPEVPKPGK